MTTTTNTDRILTEMFSRLLNIRVSPAQVKRLTHVIDGVIDKVEGSMDLETSQGRNTFRALVCSMVVHGWGLGMHPDGNPAQDLDGKEIEVKVCKDILVPMGSLQSLRYVKKDKYGRVKKALFEPDQNARIRGHIDSILDDIATRRWPDENGDPENDGDPTDPN
ncbi:MAG TPA: hypothetical protein VKA86_06565 [Candidatus Krumholzibacteria bacterium]|nr:hypothetical protein [Candidatus Krumholzibacteria bacterium]